MPQAMINNTNVSYNTYGNPENLPVLFIHGFPFSSAMWEPQVEALSSDYYLITYDVRGHGATDVGDGQYTIELFVDDLIALMDHLNLSRVVLAGLSMGGYIALRAIERNPERFKALILCDTRSEADGNEAKIKRASQVNVVKAKGSKSFAEGFLKAVFHEKTFESNPTAVDSIRKIIEATSPLGIGGTLIALAARTDTTASLSAIKVPTLILCGAHDAITPPSASQAMSEKISNSELHIIPGAAHMSNLENNEVFNKHLRIFLQQFR